MSGFNPAKPLSARTAFINQHRDREIDLARVDKDQAAKEALAAAKLDPASIKEADKNGDNVISAAEAYDFSSEHKAALDQLRTAAPEAADRFVGSASAEEALSALLGYDQVQRPGVFARAGRAVAETADGLQKSLEQGIDSLQKDFGDDYFGKTIVDGAFGVIQGATEVVTGTASLVGRATTLVDDPASRDTAARVLAYAKDNPKEFAEAMGDEFKKMIDGPITAESIGKAIPLLVTAAPSLSKKAARIALQAGAKVGVKKAAVGAGVLLAVTPGSAKAPTNGDASAPPTFKPWELARGPVR